MRKSKNNLNNKEIERVFLKKESTSGVVAVYMYRKKERNIVNIMKMQERNNDVDGGREEKDDETLQDFKG
jgi:hypothetical protein